MLNTKIKILYFIPGFYYGGIETFAVSMMEQLDGTRYQIDLLKHNNNPDNTPLLQRVLNQGGKVYNLPSFRLQHIFTYIHTTFHFVKTHSDYHVVHCHSLVHSLFLLIAARWYHIPIRILHSHTSHSDEGWLRYCMGSIFRHLSLQLATDFLSCSDIAAKWGFGNGNYQKGKVKIVHNGIELSDFSFDAMTRDKIRNEYHLSDKKVIGHIGRLTTAKNGRFLLEIMKEAILQDTSVMLMQIGDGPDLKDLKIYAHELGIANHVLFLGKKDCAADYYSAFDVFLLPSLWEGAPVSAIEAQANGLPCVMSDVITRDVDVCAEVNYVSLQSSVSAWAKTILDCVSKRCDSLISIEQLKSKGYDKMSSVRILEKLYSREK